MSQPPQQPPYQGPPHNVYIQQRQPAGCGKIALVMLAVLVGLGMLGLIGFIVLFQLT